MDFFAHSFSERAINDLMALYARFSGKCVRYDHRLKVRAIAFDRQMGAIELFAEVTFNRFGCDHGKGLPLCCDADPGGYCLSL